MGEHHGITIFVLAFCEINFSFNQEFAPFVETDLFHDLPRSLQQFDGIPYPFRRGVGIDYGLGNP